MNQDQTPIKDICSLAFTKNDINILVEAVNQLSKRSQFNDSSDIIIDLALIYHTATKLNLEPDSFLESQMNIVCKELKEHFISFMSRSPIDKTIASMGYKEAYEGGVFQYKYLY